MKEGEVLYWVLIDPDTREQVMRVSTRVEARELALECGARIAKVVVAR